MLSLRKILNATLARVFVGTVRCLGLLTEAFFVAGGLVSRCQVRLLAARPWLRGSQKIHTAKEHHTMQLTGKVLGGKTTTITTKTGTKLEKTRIRVLDIGEEAINDVISYWIDLLGDAALTDQQLAAITHTEVVIQIRRVSLSTSNGKAYLNINGGLILPLNGGEPIQSKLAQAQMGKK